MSNTVSDELLGRLAETRQLVETRVRATGEYEGWTGRDVLTHLGAYARVIAAILRAEADHRTATDVELYGRELTPEEGSLVGLDDVNEEIRREYDSLSFDEARSLWRTTHADVVSQLARLTTTQLTAPGPAYPAQWTRPQLADVVEALISHYRGHLG